MNKTINKIYFTKRKAVILEKGEANEERINKRYLATILKNIEFYGYTLSEELMERVSSLKTDKAVAFYNDLVELLKSSIGFNARKQPLYKNFPLEVMEKDESELYLDAINYYLSSFKDTPNSELIERFPLLENVDLKVIDLGSNEEFMNIFTNLLSSKSSISEDDRNILKWFVDFYKDEILDFLPTEIAFKENLAFATQICMHLDKAVLYFKNKYKTATDVLRLATAMSEGDISLATDTKFLSFKRKDRKFLLTLLNDTKNTSEDMLRYKYKWIRLGERLHPSEYKRFTVANEGFRAMRDNLKVETFNSKLEEAFFNNDFNNVLCLLKSRPGEFARRLDRVLRTFNNEEIIVAFEEVSYKIVTPLLLQVREHFSKRDNKLEQRVFFPKGNVAKAYTVPYEVKEIELNLCEKIVSVCTNALIKSYSEKESLGKVFIAEELKDYVVPTALRSSSRAVKTVARGSKMSLKDNYNVVRLFLYWKEPKGDTTDLDLSAVFYSENFENLGTVYFGNLRQKLFNCVHSGDIRQAPEGATEFIDLDLEMLKANGVRYVVSSVNSYSGNPFIELPECFIGFMERENSVLGEIFEPKTVSHKADLTSPNGVAIPMVLDIVERKAIWTDLSGDAQQLSNVKDGLERNRLLSAMKAMLNVCRPSMYDLAVLNAKARGEIVENKEEADVVFSLTEGITPFDTDIILAKFI